MPRSEFTLNSGSPLGNAHPLTLIAGPCVIESRDMSVEVAGRMKDGHPRIIVDSQNYRSRRERSLVRLAQQTADEVRRTRDSRLLEAMNPFERRLIHTTLSKERDVETSSEGDGLYKRVRVYYRGSRHRG